MPIQQVNTHLSSVMFCHFWWLGYKLLWETCSNWADGYWEWKNFIHTLVTEHCNDRHNLKLAYHLHHIFLRTSSLNQVESCWSLLGLTWAKCNITIIYYQFVVWISIYSLIQYETNLSAFSEQFSLLLSIKTFHLSSNSTFYNFIHAIYRKIVQIILSLKQSTTKLVNKNSNFYFSIIGLPDVNVNT